MADITFKIVCYRLGEAYSNMADKVEKFLEWYEDFSWRRVDILDMLFLGWLLAAFVVVGAINVYLRFFGRGKGRPGGVLLGSGPTTSGTAGETCQWLNSVLSWLFLHCDHTPDFIDAWMRGLNEQARKNALEGYQVKFDRAQAGSLPPRITAVLTQAGSDTITICAHLETSDVTLLVSALQQSGAVVKVTNYDVHLQQLRGELIIQLKVFANYRGDQIDVQAHFNNPPELRLRVTPRNEAHVSPQQIEQAVRKAIHDARTNFTISPRGGYGPMTPIPSGDNQRAEKSSLQSSPPPNVPAQFATPPFANGCPPVSANYGGSSYQQVSQSVSPKTHQAPPPRMESSISQRKNFTNSLEISVGGSKPFSLRDRRLLVKVMKANSLGQRDFDVGEPYCLMLLDQPQQRHTTSVVKNSSNPFWNEHYVFDLDDNSRQLRFEVCDRVKPAGEDFLGRAVVSIADLRRMPSTRQIIPLTGKPGTQGTITVEFLFMEPGEVQNLQLSNMSTDVDAISPRRQVETSRRVMPGGTIVTTTTTTTEKPKDIRLDSSFQEPQRIQKTETNYATDYSPYSQRSPNFLAAHESASNASSQVVDAQGRHLEGPRLMVTSPYDNSKIATAQQAQQPITETKKGNKSPLMSIFRKTPTTTVTTTTMTPTNVTAPTAGNRNSMPIESYIIQQPQQNAPHEGAYENETLPPNRSPRFNKSPSRTAPEDTSYMQPSSATTSSTSPLSQQQQNQFQQQQQQQFGTTITQPHSEQQLQQQFGQHQQSSLQQQQQQQLQRPFVSRFRKPPLGEPVVALEDPEYEQSIASEYSGYEQASSLVDPREAKKSKGFASALRKRFSRGPKKPRSHSADRAGSLRQENLLKPPEQGARTTDHTHGYTIQGDDLGRVDHDMQQEASNLRKSRSHSFSNSLKRIFRKKKKQGPGEYPSSRESSVSRGYSDRAYSEEPQPSPHTGGRSPRWRENRYSEDIARVPDSRHLLSTSVPLSAPIYDH